MRIEVLYIPGCPHRYPAVKQVSKALESERIQAEIRQVEISDNVEAQRIAFPGSPTIRINGYDVVPVPWAADRGGLQCRLYAGAEPAGVPPLDAVRRALREAGRKGTV